MVKLLIKILCLLLSISCGKKSGGGREPSEPNSAAHNDMLFSVDSPLDIPPCNKDSDGKIVYIKSVKTFYTCNTNEWTVIDLTGPSGKDAEFKASYVKDGAGIRLGVLLGAYWSGLQIMSDKGYMYSIGWDGAITNISPLYYTEENCEGEPNSYSTEHASYGKIVHVDSAGLLYKPANIDKYGNSDGVSLEYKSMYNYGSGCHSYTYVLDGFLIDLTPTTREEAGIPSSIFPKISIVN